VTSQRVVRGVADTTYVRAQDATEAGLAARTSIEASATGIDARDVALGASLVTSEGARRRPIVFIAER